MAKEKKFVSHSYLSFPSPALYFSKATRYSHGYSNDFPTIQLRQQKYCR